MSSLAHDAPSEPIYLAPLREELTLYPGPTALDGSPTWTLHDPANNQFYRIGWLEFEILSRWHLGTTDAVAVRVSEETTLDIDGDDVKHVLTFLLRHDLARPLGSGGTVRLVKKAARARHHWAMWLLKHYLFLRIRLVRPDRFLTATYPLVAWIYSRTFVGLVSAVFLTGLYLIGRRWEEFKATFNYFFSFEGFAYFAITLSVLKIVHELGHAYTAKRFGCRVPSMGVAFLVLWPVLYTDVTESWKVRSRKGRLLIGSAGVLTELVFAAFATFAWGFLPDGPGRSAAFFVATSTWITTLLINLSPFMRFDGYFVLSDWLEMPNLHPRAFALARWWMREMLFGLGDPPPEHFPPGRQRFLIVFAFLTWAYRLSVFLGIAALVYHFTIKILGIALMMVEVVWFMARPILSEVRVWWLRRGSIRFGPRPIIAGLGALMILAALLVPWRSTIDAPALLKSRRYTEIFVPGRGARIERLSVKNGDRVSKDELLVRLSSPDLDYDLERARDEMNVLQWQLSAQSMNADLLARSQVTQSEYEATVARYRGLEVERKRLDLTAPIVGFVVDMPDDLHVGTWVPSKSRLLTIIEPGTSAIQAYVYEADLGRIATGDVGMFFPEGGIRPTIRVRVTEIDRASVRVVTEPYLASKYGGAIPVREIRRGELTPERTIYRISLVPDEPTEPARHVLRGEVALRGRSESLIARAWRAFYAVAVRESGA